MITPEKLAEQERLESPNYTLAEAIAEIKERWAELERVYALVSHWSSEARRLETEKSHLQSELADYQNTVTELLATFRDHFRCENLDAMTLFMVALVGGIKEEWIKALPENGFTTTANWAGIGQVEIAIRRIDGKSPAESINELQAENTALRNSIINQSGDNLCWLKGNEVQIPPREQFLESCARYHAQISGERGEAEGCRTIAQLEAEVARLQAELQRLQPQLFRWYECMAGLGLEIRRHADDEWRIGGYIQISKNQKRFDVCVDRQEETRVNATKYILADAKVELLRLCGIKESVETAQPQLQLDTFAPGTEWPKEGK